MFLEKCRPKSLSDIVGNSRQINEIKGFLAKWKQGTALLVHGPPGCGKSLCIELIAAEGGYELVESHASDERGYKELKESLMKATAQRSLFYKKKIILVDELELIDSVKGIMEIMRESRHPVVLIASNPYEQKLAQLRRACVMVKFDKIRTDTIAALLKSICRSESIDRSDAQINQIARTANGDVRSAIIDLESRGAAGHRDKEESIFETLKILFKTLDLNNSRYAVESSEKSPEDIFMWLEENIPNEYERSGEIAAAYECLAKADMVAARIIKRQAWTLQKYYIGFLCGVSFAKQQPYKKFTAYAFPRFRANVNDAVAQKIAKKLHVSRKQALQQLHLISIIKNRKQLAAELELTEDEVEMLG